MKKIFLLLAAVLLLGSGCQTKAQQEKAFVDRQLKFCETELTETHNKLNQANENIEQAKSYSWSDFDAMGYALNNLKTVE